MVRGRLDAERERLMGLRRQLLWPGVDGVVSGLPERATEEHPADAASETFERSKDLSILRAIEASLAELDWAAERLDAGRYGVCQACGQPIDPSRLEVLPASRYCRADQAELERVAAGGGASRATPLKAAVWG